MRLLIFYSHSFEYETNHKSLQAIEEISEKKVIENAIVGFIHVEEKDLVEKGNVETKLVKNLKWAARKNGTNRIVLHSFNHLSVSNADPDFTKSVFDRVEERLIKSDYETYQTPFGYFLNLNMDAPGFPLARIFKEF